MLRVSVDRSAHLGGPSQKWGKRSRAIGIDGHILR